MKENGRFINEEKELSLSLWPENNHNLMNYSLISEYIEALMFAEDNFY